MSERRQKKVIVYSGSEDETTFPSTDASEFMAWVRDKMSEIPAEHMSGAQIEISSSVCYDSSSAEIDIYYYRPETDAEMSARIEQEECDRRHEKEREIRLLNSLKAKYEQ